MTPKLSEPRPKKNTALSPPAHVVDLSGNTSSKVPWFCFKMLGLCTMHTVIERRWRRDVVRSPNINFHESRRSLLDAFESAGKPITIVPSLGWSSRGLSKSQIRPTSISDRTSVTSLKSFPPGSLLAQSWKIKNIASYPLEKSNWFWRFTDIRIPLDPWDKRYIYLLMYPKKIHDWWIRIPESSHISVLRISTTFRNTLLVTNISCWWKKSKRPSTVWGYPPGN